MDGANQIILRFGSRFSAACYTFVAGHAAGADLITGFQAGTDKLILKGVSVVSQQVQDGSDTVVFSDGGRLTLQGVSSQQTFASADQPIVH